MASRLFALDSAASLAQLFIAMIWIVFGLVFKLLRAVPRHQQIVARIVGERMAPTLTRLIGVGECFIGAWMISGWQLAWCVLLQTALIATMNVIELRKARDLLLAPWPMVIANIMLLTIAWYAALARR